jgi:hypothetical protein
MADANSQAIETLIQAMQKVSDDKIESATFDTTDIGKIEEVLDNNKYSVSITGTVYTVPSCVTDSFSTGDNVLVLSCKNNKTAKYIIGKTSAAKTGGVSVGDMLKSIYDTDSDGKVDSAENADTVGGFTVEKSVPSDAVFTDTIYVHPATHSADIIVDGTTNKSYTATEQTKLSGISIGANKAESSTTNGNIKINGIETTVYTHPPGTNPHGTTKSDVGLGNADNTADASKNVLSATKLTTARTINGVSFDGSANITIADSTKEPAITSGTVSQFWSGTKTWRDLATDVRAIILTGLSTSTNTVISATDSILVALGKLQKQITDHLSDAVKHITATERTNWNTAYTNNHTHSNKSVLDATTASYTTAEKTKLSGIATGAEVNVNSDWSATSGDAQILNKPTTISGYGITDAYTKAEIDNKVSAVYRYKGDVASYSNLPSSGQVTGDVYNVTDTGVNYAWNGTTWDDIGGTEALATASNNGLITKEDFTKLSGIATGATKNDTDANLKNRSNHTGTQPASTISDFNSAALGAAPAETIVSIGTLVNGATAKNTPVDADMIPLMDSADSNKIKKLSWAYVKSALSPVFAALSHTHTISNITDLTATATELNYTDGVTGNIQSQLDSKFSKNCIQFVTNDDLNTFLTAGLYGTPSTAVITSLLNKPSSGGECQLKVEYAGSGSYVIQTFIIRVSSTNLKEYARTCTVSSSTWSSWKEIATTDGNIATATKLSTARIISLSGDVTGSTSFDGSANISITSTVADNSHLHTASNISDLTATAAEINVLDGIAATTTELNYCDGVTSNIQTQLNSKANMSNLAAVATSGSYSDLSNKPAIPTILNTMISRANDNSAPAGSTQIDANLLDGYDSSYFANIKLSSTQPTGQRVNDFWLQIV